MLSDDVAAIRLALPPSGRVYVGEAVRRSGLPLARGWSAMAWLCAAGEVEVAGGWVRWRKTDAIAERGVINGKVSKCRQLVLVNSKANAG